MVSIPIRIVCGFLYEELSLKTEHEIRIGGLIPHTRYFYQIEDKTAVMAAADSSQYWITSPPIGSLSPLRAWILGDPGTADANARAVRDAYYSYADSQHTDMLILLGDNASPQGSDADYQQAVFDSMYEDILRRSVLWTAPGEEEFANGLTASATETGPYFDIFSLPRNAEAGGLASGTEAYYAYDYGPVHFVSLDSYDSDRDPVGPMLTWLEHDLALTRQPLDRGFFHHPPYAKGKS